MKLSPPALPHVKGKRRPLIHGLILLLILGSALYTAFFPGHLFSPHRSATNPMAGLSLPGVAAGVPQGFNPLRVSQVPGQDVELSMEVDRLARLAADYGREEPVIRVFAAAVSPEPDVTPPAIVLEPPPIFTIYEVQPGDTVSSIAGQFGLQPESVVWNNVDISDEDLLAVGQLLRIPAMDGVIHEVRLEDNLASPEPEVTQTLVTLEPPPIFTIYEVQPGDTVSSIAGAYGLQPESVVWNNVDISDEDLLAVGQLLRIPAMDGVIHEVRLGDTLSDIVARYDAELSAVSAFASNGIDAADDIQEKQLVFVPGGTVPPPPEPEPEEVQPAELAEGEVAAAPAVPFTPSAGLIWPVTGPISSYMGPSHPLGIDVDLYNNPNAAVLASTAGVVTFAGGDPCCSYGLYVVIVSPGGIETLYAHLSSINVVQGQQASQGDVIGYAGCTGYCTGNHLHFEVIDNGVRQSPLSYLP